MSEAIIVALITGVCSVGGVVISNIASNNKMSAQFKINQALIEQKLETMNEQLKKHNSLVDRMYKVEKDVAVIKEQLSK